MTMTALVHTNAKGNIIIQLKGSLDYEYSGTLQRELESILKEHPTSMVTLDMFFLDFVGSSGIGTFVNTIALFNRPITRVNLSNVKPEFLKVFKLYSFYDVTQIIEEVEGPMEEAA